MNFSTNLHDILSKREFLFRQFPALSLSEISNYPSNSLINDFKNLIYTNKTSSTLSLPFLHTFNLNKLEQV